MNIEVKSIQKLSKDVGEDLPCASRPSGNLLYSLSCAAQGFARCGPTKLTEPAYGRLGPSG
jgi:hypothetical protein